MALSRVGEGIGIQLSHLRALARKIAQDKVLFYFLEDADFESGEEVVEVKKGFSFFHIKGQEDICFCESINKNFSFHSLQQIEDKFEERSFNQYTVQDVSDLTRWYVRKNHQPGTPLINTAAIHSYRKGDPFDCAYVICPRNVNFNQLVASLNKHVQQKKVFVDEEDYYVWIDIFCSSLYQSKAVSDEEELKSNLTKMQEDITKFSEVLIFFDSIREPLALRRLWCIWELYMASKVSDVTPLSILFPSKVSISTLILLDFDVLIETVLGLDPMSLESANSTASNAIRSLLTTLPEGFKTVIDSIKATLCSWLTTLVIREYDTAQNINKSLVLVTELYLDVGMFLINISGNDRNARICKDKAAEIIENKKFDRFFQENDSRILCETKRELLKEKILLRQGALFISVKMSTFNKQFLKFKKELKHEKFTVEGFLGTQETNALARPQVFGRLTTVAMQSKPGRTKTNKTAFTRGKPQIPHLSTNGFSMLSTNTFASIQRSNDHVQSSKYLAGKFKDRRSNEEKVLDVQLQLLVAQSKYDSATKVMNVILNQYNENENEINRLFGGLSAASLSFKYARQLFQKGGRQDILQAQEQYKKALEFSTDGKVYQRAFIREKCAYYLALSFALTNAASVFNILRENFFKPRGVDIRSVNAEEPFVIGCTRRAAQVFFLLHAHAPAQLKAQVGEQVFEKIGELICMALFGEHEADNNGDTLEEYIGKLRDPIVQQSQRGDTS